MTPNVYVNDVMIGVEVIETRVGWLYKWPASSAVLYTSSFLGRSFFIEHRVDWIPVTRRSRMVLGLRGQNPNTTQGALWASNGTQGVVITGSNSTLYAV